MSTFQIQSSEVLARLKPFGITFEKSLTDLIKGIRAHSKNSPESLSNFLNDAIQECKDELMSTDIEVKATAALKLAYLEMYGFDMSWSNFNILEVMSSSKFQQKRIGYLAATQSFKNEQDLLILATNQFKKDLNSHNHTEVGLALSGIATIVTPNLAKDVVDDILMKLSHSKPYIRKKAVLALFKVFVQYPESLKSSLPRVMEKLDDSDVSVVSATITVVCEISKKNPHLFLNYLPKFFSILEETTNNWLIIRILKLFQSLSRIEQRMKKRIMPSILNLMSKSEATSIKYECINCIVDGGMLNPDSSKDKEVAKVCIDHILTFYAIRYDPNLWFVGLLALIKIIKIYPHFIHKISRVASVITQCLTDKEIVIKRKALEICHYLVTEDNLADLVKTLLLQLLPENSATDNPDGYKLEITSKILQITSSDNYAHIPNFKWYVIALKELVNLTLLADTTLENSGATQLSISTTNQIAEMVGAEFQSLALKVPSIRPFLLATIVLDYVKSSKLIKGSPKLMASIYWIMGEYPENFGHSGKNNDDDDEIDEITSLSQKVTIFNSLVNVFVDERLLEGTLFPISKAIIELDTPETLCVLIEAVVKLFSSIVGDYEQIYGNSGKLSPEKYAEIAYFLKKLIALLEHWENDDQYIVQERSLVWLEFLKLCLDSMNLTDPTRVNTLETQELEYYKNALKKSRGLNGDDVISEHEEYGDSEVDDDSDEDEENGDGDVEDEDDEENDDDDVEDGSEEINDQEAKRDEKIVKTLDEVANSKIKGVVEEESKIEDGDGLVFRPNSSTFQDSSGINGDVGSLESSKELPQLLNKLLKSFFRSYELKPVSATAQRRIPVPESLDLDSVINNPPSFCLQDSAPPSEDEVSEDEDEQPVKAADRNASASERLSRLKDDPYYISNVSKSKPSKIKPTITGLESEIINLTPESYSETASVSQESMTKPKKSKKIKKEKVVVLQEENLGYEEALSIPQQPVKPAKKPKNKFIINSLQLDETESNSLGSHSESTRGDQEYKVDLDQLRSQLADRTKKKAKKKAKKIASEGDAKTGDMAVDVVDSAISAPKSEKKKKKKKKKAIIEE